MKTFQPITGWFLRRQYDFLLTSQKQGKVPENHDVYGVFTHPARPHAGIPL